MADEVRVAADGRREVAVARRLQPGVAEVRRRVAGLLERAQDERREGQAAVPGAAHVLVDQHRALRDDVRRLRGRERLGHRRRRDVQRRELVDQAQHRLRLRALVDAVERRDRALVEHRRHRLVGGDHQVLDQPMRLGLDRRHRLDEVAAAVEGELRLDRLDGQRAAALAAGLQRRRRRARGRERLGPRRLRLLVAGEDPVDAVVVQALVGADERAMEGRLDGLRAAQLELDGDRQAIDPRAQRAGVVRQRLGQHRLDRAGHVDRGRAAVGLAVDRSRPAARRPRRRRCGPRRASARRRGPRTRSRRRSRVR